MGLKSSIVRLMSRMVGIEKAYKIVYHLRRSELSALVAADCGNEVQHGPFTGMVLSDQASWAGGGDRAAKLMGLYEAELHPALRLACERSPRTVLNIGCAEGYYAVGLARLLPNAKVFAFDIDAKARELCAAAAVKNGVGDRVTVREATTCEGLSEFVGSGSSTLVVMDCEGHEGELLDPRVVPALSQCDMIVEAHDCFVPHMMATLMQRFRDTHEVQVIGAGARDPAAVLPQWPEADRWLVVNEGRPAGMSWLACWSLRVALPKAKPLAAEMLSG